MKAVKKELDEMFDSYKPNIKKEEHLHPAMKPKKKNKKTIKVKKKKKKIINGYYFDGNKSYTLYEDHWSTK